MDNKQITFKLIEASLKREKVLFETDDENGLLKILFENGLIGLVFNSIDKNSFKEPKYYQKLKEIFGQYVSKDIQQLALIDSLKKLFSDNKIDHIFLKGAHLKFLYPETYMRGMGDIDLLVRKEQFEEAKTLLESDGYKFQSAESHHHVYDAPDGSVIELHKKLGSFNDKDYETILNEVWNYIEGRDFEKKIKYEFEYIHLLIHLARHIKNSGVGIRSVLDLSIYNHKLVKDETLLIDLLNRAKLKSFHHRIQYLADIFMNLIPIENTDIAAINFIINSGIHGHGTEHNPYISKRAYQKTRKHKNRFIFFLSEVFPSLERLEEGYPYLKKHPWLLPWAWFVRILKQLFKPKNTIKRIESMTDDSDLEKVDRIYTYLGL